MFFNTKKTFYKIVYQKNTSISFLFTKNGFLFGIIKKYLQKSYSLFCLKKVFFSMLLIELDKLSSFYKKRF